METISYVGMGDSLDIHHHRYNHYNNNNHATMMEDEDDDLLEKIEMCCTLYNFADDSADVNSKCQKRRALHKLVVELAAERVLSEEAYAKLLNMISINVFRSSPSKDQTVVDPTSNYPGVLAVEPSWEHLKWVYELFLVLLTSAHFHNTLAKHHIDRTFIVQLLNLLESGDSRERRYLLRIIYQIYKNFVYYRPVIRQETINIFLKFLYETRTFNGIDEMVELLGIIIHGLSVPLKEKHKVLVRILLPLHRMNCLQLYHRHLTYCVLEMIRKNQAMAEYFVEGLLNNWPRTSATNQVMFILELKEIMAVVTYEQFVKIQTAVFDQVAKCSASLHYNVAETALGVWNEDGICRMVEKNAQDVIPILFPALCQVIEEHWSKKIVADALKVLTKFKMMNSFLMQGLIRAFKFEHRREERKKKMEEEMLRRFASLDHILVNLSHSN